MDEFTKARIEDWWPCACVKGGNWRKRKPSTHIKLNAPERKRCSTCGCTKALRVLAAELRAKAKENPDARQCTAAEAYQDAADQLDTLAERTS